MEIMSIQNGFYKKLKEKDSRLTFNLCYATSS